MDKKHPFMLADLFKFQNVKWEIREVGEYDWRGDGRSIEYKIQPKNNEIAFSNPKDVSLHINEIWNDIDKWWSSKDVKNTINDLLLATCQLQDDSINIWAKFLKNEIKKNI